MPYVIALPCIGVKDTACVAICPCDCIHPTKDEPDFASAEQLYIDPNVCIDCGLCVQECPVNAIFPEDDLPAEWHDYLSRNASYYNK
jgi:NAD-dependent dihydropyrimidine dehydrogenase PreA subunit